MPDHSTHKAGDLARDERLVVERWLGRDLANDETISVNAYREIGSRVPDADEEYVDALLDEPIDAARDRRG